MLKKPLAFAFCVSLCPFWLPAGTQEADRDEKEFARQREEMVASQLQARGIRNRRVLEAMKKVPRHRFVPSEFRQDAYSDTPLPIGSGQTISQPFIVALMTELADPRPHHRALEVGTGSGYQAAVLAELAREVYTIDIIPALAEGARRRLSELGYTDIHVRAGDGYQGWPEKAPFDLILVTAAAEQIPKPLLDQLAEGGKLVIPIGQTYGGQLLTLVIKKNGKLKKTVIADVQFVPMTGEVRKRH